MAQLWCGRESQNEPTHVVKAKVGLKWGIKDGHHQGGYCGLLEYTPYCGTSNIELSYVDLKKLQDKYLASFTNTSYICGVACMSKTMY
jgi:hypothetical protein